MSLSSNGTLVNMSVTVGKKKKKKKRGHVCRKGKLMFSWRAQGKTTPQGMDITMQGRNCV